MRLIQASAHQLPMLADKSVHVICTSPPYFNLRAYEGAQDVEWPTVDYSPIVGLPTLHIQGCEPDCDHEWKTTVRPPRTGGKNSSKLQIKDSENFQTMAESGSAYCIHCGGWRGALGREPAIEMYIGHLILCLREWHRILRDDGTLWINISDSFAGSGGAGGDYNVGGIKEGQPKYNGAKPQNLPSKNLCGVPQRFVLAAQADGWYWRGDIIGNKIAPMPESVRDRPTRSHEYIYLLTKKAKYFFDMEAVREPAAASSLKRVGQANFANQTGGPKDMKHHGRPDRSMRTTLENFAANPGRQLRDVWEWRPTPSNVAHFATWPESIPTTMIKAGTSQKGCCPKCAAPWVRIIERTPMVIDRSNNHPEELRTRTSGTMLEPPTSVTIGWKASCKCGIEEVVPCTVFDPFHGSGSTAVAAIKLGRDYIGVDISEEYLTTVTNERFKKGIQMEMNLDA